MKDSIRIVDYTTSGPVLEYPVSYLSEKLLELVSRLEDKRNEYLNKVKNNIEDVEDAVLVMAALTSNTPLEGKFSDIQDYLKHSSKLSNKIETIYTFLNNFNNLKTMSGITTWVKLTKEQAQEFGL